ncbi:hypothetical protein RKD49_004297 [Streptomyces glaucescens]
MSDVPTDHRPPGPPRWVLLIHQPASASWRVCAESPYRGPVRYALGEMTQTLRARGESTAVTLWGPKDGAWHRYDTEAPARTPAATGTAPRPEPARLAERMTDRRHQVLMAGLGKAGLYDLTDDDWTAVHTLVDRLDETTVRRLAQWLTTAGTAG